MKRAGKTYLVTGGASGLGASTIRRLHSQGANVIIADRDDEAGTAMAAELGAERSLFAEMDVTDTESIARAIDQGVAKFGGLSGAVNCAGVGSASTTLGRSGPMPMEIFDIVMSINIGGTFNVCRLAAAQIAKQTPDADNLRGVIINVASVAAYDGQKGQVPYSASKGAVVSMSLPMARDLARVGIRVLAIAPGTMETPMMAAASDKVRENLFKQVVSPKRLGQSDEFAHLVEMIIDNSYLNAECIRLDAGIRMANL